MKNKLLLLLSVSIVSLTACGITPRIYSEQDVIDAMVKEAQNRIDAHGKVGTKKDIIPSSALKEYPASFDLRSVDFNNDGKKENYVTDVKFQNPFGSCWSFGSIAAAETSILTDLKQEAIVDDKNTIDLSEHHTAWFVYTPMPEGDVQEGEGLYSMVEGVYDNPSLKLSSGSTQFAAGSVWASGMGVVQEPDFESTEGIEALLNYHGKERITTTTSKGYPIYSKEDDWSIDESLRFKQTYMLENSICLPEPLYFNKDGSMDLDYCELVSKSYKEQLMNGRALVVGFQADSYSPDSPGRVAKYINTDTYAHYTYEPKTQNHSVCIVGWDDNYSKTNFLNKVQYVINGVPAFDKDGKPIMKDVPQPPKDGAWIVKNSWGSLDSISDGLNINKWGVNGSGYFYLSYYDMSLGSVQAFDFDVTNKIKGDLGEYAIDEYDLMPNENPHNIETNFPVVEGNVFTAEQNEIVKYVSCVSTEHNEEMTFDFYNFVDEKIDVDHPILEFKKQFDYKGIHVVQLPTTIALNKDQKIAVAITQKSGSKYFMSVGSEYNLKGYLNDLCDDQYYAVGVVNKGESFVCVGNEVYDFSDIKQKVENLDGPTSYLAYDNFPIKLYSSLIGE